MGDEFSLKSMFLVTQFDCIVVLLGVDFRQIHLLITYHMICATQEMAVFMCHSTAMKLLDGNYCNV